MLRIISRNFIILNICILMITSTAFAKVYTDIEGKDYQRAVTVLSALEIFKGASEDEFKPDDNVTRQDFETVLSKLQGVEDVNIPENQDSTKIDEIITFEEAVKRIVDLIGYGLDAQQRGGYPSGYLAVASEKHILKNIPTGQPLSRGMFAQMVYNAIDVDIMQQQVYGDKAQYASEDGKTLLTENLKITKGTGIVTANSRSDLSGHYSLGKNELEIGGEIYKCTQTTAQDYLGCEVEFYSKVDDVSNENTILYAEKTDDNQILSIPANNIVDYNSLKYTYFKDKDKDTANSEVSLPNSVDIIYNGKAITKADFQLINFKPDAGKVVLIDNNGDGQYEVLSIESYENYVVDSVDISDNYIYPKYGKDILQLDVDDNSKRVTISDRDGNPVLLSDIYEWDVLSVTDSIDHNVKNVIVTKEVAEGNVDEVGEEDGFAVYMVQDKALKLAAGYPISILDDVKVGDAFKFYLDVEGRVAGYQFDNNSDLKIAYLMAAGTTQGLDRRVQIKVFDVEQQAAVVLNCSDKTTVNDVQNNVVNEVQKNTDQLMTVLCDNNGKVRNSLIRYRINEDNNVVELQLPYDNNNSINDGPNCLQLMYKSPVKNPSTGARDGCWYSIDGKVFHIPILKSDLSAISNWVDGFSVNSQTTFLFVPSDRNDAEGYQLKKITDYAEGQVIVDAYRTSNDADSAEIVVQYAGDGSETSGSSDANDIDGITKDTLVYLIDKITTVIDKDGNTVNKIYAYSKNGKKEMYVKNAKLVSDLGVKEGDMVRFATDGSDRIKGIQLLLSDAQRHAQTGFIPSGMNSLSEFRYLFGDVYKKSNASIFLTTNDPTNSATLNLLTFQLRSFLKVYVYDVEKKTVKDAKISDVYDYLSNANVRSHSRVFIHTKSGAPQLMVIYNGL